MSASEHTSLDDTEVDTEEVLARLRQIRSESPKGRVPGYEMQRAAAELQRSVGHVRRLLSAQAPAEAVVPFVFSEWYLPLYYAHGNLLDLHRDLIDTRKDLAESGEVVPKELEEVPDSYTTFWRSYSKLPARTREFHRKGANGYLSRVVYLRWQAEKRQRGVADRRHAVGRLRDPTGMPEPRKAVARSGLGRLHSCGDGLGPVLEAPQCRGCDRHLRLRHRR